ncbi:MAG: NADH-quinone oxidoreductase subunit H, partial [Phycisphaerae bacterium]
AGSQLAFSCLLMVGLLGVIYLGVAYCTFYERKTSAWMQNRVGPNRVGFFGLLRNFHFWGLGQPMADGVKFLLKEDIIPGKVDKPLFLLAPAIVLMVATVSFAVIPWGGDVDLTGDGVVDVTCQVANPDIGLLYLLGVGAMGIYGVVLGGWSSNNKYSFYGGMRAAAQMLSYEIPMGLAILVVVITTGQLRLEGIVESQVGVGNTWNIFVHPLAFGLLLVTQFAETNRAPFDLAECEQELVGGFHTEYSSMKFAMFFLAEYTHMIVNSAFLCVLFLGGWELLPFDVPGFRAQDTSILAMLLKMLVMGGKIAACIFFYMWVRWTLPRFRFDQLMRLAWRGLVPMGMGLAALATVMVYYGVPGRTSWWPKVAWGLIGNAAVLVLVMMVVGLTRGRVTGRQQNLRRIGLLEPARPRRAATGGFSTP